MDLLSHPFRLTANGAIATVDQDSDEAAAEAIAVLCLTVRGERDLVPEFGITDPTFGELAVAELNVALADYGPDVAVVDAITTAIDDRTERVVLSFEPQE